MTEERTEFNGSQQIAVRETASTAMAAQQKAMVESRYVMAMRNPRNWDLVRQDVLQECKRPAFANNKSAYYRKPIGGGKFAENLGIRFAEVALRCCKNLMVETPMVFDSEDYEIHRVTVTDLESNNTYTQDVKVTKTVERSRPNDDGSYISMRENSNGKATYTVPATEDSLLNKRGALISKALRNLSLRVLPGDIQDEATEIIKRIRTQDAASDPTAARKAIVDAFFDIGVKADQLSTYLGHSIEQCAPAELADLRAIFGAIRDGETTWAAVADTDEQDDRAGVMATIRELAAKKRAAKQKPADPEPPQQPDPTPPTDTPPQDDDWTRAETADLDPTL